MKLSFNLLVLSREYWNILRSYRDSGQENVSYYTIVGYIHIYICTYIYIRVIVWSLEAIFCRQRG